MISIECLIINFIRDYTSRFGITGSDKAETFCVSMSSEALKSPRYISIIITSTCKLHVMLRLSLSLSPSLSPSPFSFFTYVVSVEYFGGILYAPPDSSSVGVEVFHRSLYPLLLESLQLFWVIVVVKLNQRPPWSLHVCTLCHHDITTIKLEIQYQARILKIDKKFFLLKNSNYSLQFSFQLALV